MCTPCGAPIWRAGQVASIKRPDAQAFASLAMQAGGLWQCRDLDRAHRHGELGADLREPLQQPEVDRLLNVHVKVVAWVPDNVDTLELQRLFAEAAQVSAIETRLLLGLDGVFYDGWRFLHGLGGRVVGKPELEHDATLLQALVILDGAADHAGVGHDDLFAAEAADACGFEADVLNGARQGPDDDEVTDLERLVHGDRQRSEQVAKDILHSQRHRDAAHAKAGDEGGDVHPQVRQHCQHDD